MRHTHTHTHTHACTHTHSQYVWQDEQVSTGGKLPTRLKTAGLFTLSHMPSHTHTHTRMHTYTQSVCVARRTGDYRGEVANQAKDSRAVHTLTHGLTPN